MNTNPTYREIEKKFQLLRWRSLENVGLVINELLDMEKVRFRTVQDCRTTDVYWPETETVQIARTRDSIGVSGDGEYRMLKEVTVKVKDKGHNFNRLEINSKIECVRIMGDLLSTLLGTGPIGKIEKVEQIWFVESKDGEVVISTCQIGDTIYLEVEGPNQKRVDHYCEVLGSLFKMQAEPRSFFEIYIQKPKAVA